MPIFIDLFRRSLLFILVGVSFLNVSIAQGAGSSTNIVAELDGKTLLTGKISGAVYRTVCPSTGLGGGRHMFSISLHNSHGNQEGAVEVYLHPIPGKDPIFDCAAPGTKLIGRTSVNLQISCGNCSEFIVVPEVWTPLDIRCVPVFGKYLVLGGHGGGPVQPDSIERSLAFSVTEPDHVVGNLDFLIKGDGPRQGSVLRVRGDFDIFPKKEKDCQ